MPFYKMGEQAATISPAMRNPEHLGLPKASREEIDAWFNNTILALQDDPYVHMEMDHSDYSDLFIVLNPETNSADSIWASSMSIQEYEYMQKELLFEKSLAGQLFYYDPTLEEYGGFRQLYTKQVTVDGKQDYELCVTDNVTELPKTAPVKPQHPGRWKYLFYPFFAGQFKEYKAQMKEYESRRGDFEKITRLEYALADEKYRLGEYVYERTNGHFGTTFEHARDIQADKLEAYEITKQQEKPIIQEQLEPLPQAVEQNEAVNQENQKEKDINAQIDDKVITRGLRPYSPKSVQNALKSMAFSKEVAQEIVPANCPVKITGEDLGVLCAMAMGDPKLYFKDKDQKVHTNKPDIYYNEVVGAKHIDMRGMGISREGRHFERAAQRTTGSAVRNAAKSDFNRMAEIIAAGLTQNNKMLQAQRQLSDTFTTYAELGNKALQLMESNAQLKEAVMNCLGNDPQQINIAKAAKNISDFRVQTMEVYPKMAKEYGVFVKYTVEKNGQKVTKERPATLGKEADVAKVMVLSDIEVNMNIGQFKLDGSKYTDPAELTNMANDLQSSAVVHSFLWTRERGDLLKDPVKMKLLNAAAKEEHTAQKEKQPKMKDLGENRENQPKERAMDISVG